MFLKPQMFYHFVVEFFNFLVEFETQISTVGMDEQYLHLERFEKLLIQFIQFSGIGGTPLLIAAFALQRWMHPFTSALFGFDYIPAFVNTTHMRWERASIFQLVLYIILSIWIITDLTGGFIFHVMIILPSKLLF